jgi:phosphoribosylformimino-5-aminoimidazole carboxamide ribotide isomerase
VKEAQGIKSLSGGISTYDELPKLAELGCEGTIIGKAIYEGLLKQLKITFWYNNVSSKLQIE